MRKQYTHPRLPAGFGTVRYLGEGRQRPYAVHPCSRSGRRLGAICYTRDWVSGVVTLAAWNAGRYWAGMEREVEETVRSRGDRLGVSSARQEDLVTFCRGIVYGGPASPAAAGGRDLCLREVFEKYFRDKYGEGAARRLSEGAAKHARCSFRKLQPLAERTLDSITVDELQGLINGIGLKRSAVQGVLSLVKGLYRYALAREICRKNPAAYVCLPDVAASVHHQAFTDDELAILWKYPRDPMVRMILIMCYSGFRFSAFRNLETRLEEGYFRGGVKTAAGRDRIVPIHSAIRPLVEETLREDGAYLCGLSQYAFIRKMAEKLRELGIDDAINPREKRQEPASGYGIKPGEKRQEPGNRAAMKPGEDPAAGLRHHTPHSCRHTFSRLCESYGVRDADRRRMMGHSFKGDITNGVYGHRTLKELRQEIEKIQVRIPPEGCADSGRRLKRKAGYFPRFSVY